MKTDVMCAYAMAFYLFTVVTGVERFEEAIDYIEKYQLHEAALGIWKNTDRYVVG